MATSTHLRLTTLACLAGVVLTAVPSAQKRSPAPILAAAADYIAKYERDVISVVAQEDYRQRIASATVPTRQLRSDLVMIADAERGWIEYRDVYQVDGITVRDHDDRIARLFLKANRNAHQQAATIVEESARFNLSPAGMAFERTLNIPLEALRFLRTVNQPRSQFEVEGEERADSGTIVVLKFKEQTKPRLIHSPLDAAASGRFWIDSASGAVVRSELKMSAPDVLATITVTYARQFETGTWLPASMVEDYDVKGTTTIEGYATYSRFRRFDVDVSTDLKTKDN